MRKICNVRILAIMASVLICTSCDKINIQNVSNDNVATEQKTEKPIEDNITQEKEESKIPENATMVDMDTLEKDYCVVLDKDIDWCIDLDGDGTYEVVRYLACENEVLFVINDREIKCEDIINSEGGFMMLPNNEFAIVDLDNTDNKYQLAVSNEGPSGDPNSDFVSYEKGKLEYIGWIYSYPEGMDFNIDNTPGKFKHIERIDAIRTTSVNEYLQYDKINKEFKLMEQEYLEYTHYDDENMDNTTLLKNLTVYKTDDKTSDTLTIKAQDVHLEKIRFVYKDDNEKEEMGYDVGRYWVLIQAKDGTEGWIYVERGSEGERVNGELLEEYFGNLYCD